MYKYMPPKLGDVIFPQPYYPITRSWAACGPQLTGTGFVAKTEPSFFLHRHTHTHTHVKRQTNVIAENLRGKTLLRKECVKKY